VDPVGPYEPLEPFFTVKVFGVLLSVKDTVIIFSPPSAAEVVV
jgi:hypothetical protein